MCAVCEHWDWVEFTPEHVPVITVRLAILRGLSRWSGDQMTEDDLFELRFLDIGRWSIT